MENKKKISVKKMIIAVILILLLLLVLSITINFYRVKQGKNPFFAFTKTVNSLDGSMTYNIFPYKITNYRNSVNDESYTEITLVFQPYNNKFYNPDSSKYVFTKEEYKPPVFNLNTYVKTIEDVLSKVNNNNFKIGSDSNYNNIYIETGLTGENLNQFKNSIENLIKEKHSNKKLEFTTLSNLREKEILKNDLITDGIYIKIVLLENKEKEDIVSLELITNKTKIFSQKISLRNDDMTFIYRDDFNQSSRIEKEKQEREELLRKQAEEKAEKERIEKERLEKEKAELELQNQINEHKRREERLNLLMSKNNLFILDLKKAFIEADLIKTIINNEKDPNYIKSYNFVRINSDKIIYHYQEQIIENKSHLVYIKEKQLSDIEYAEIMKSLEEFTGYSGVGKYKESQVLAISYLGKSKNILIDDIIELFEKYNFKI